MKILLTTLFLCSLLFGGCNKGIDIEGNPIGDGKWQKITMLVPFKSLENSLSVEHEGTFYTLSCYGFNVWESRDAYNSFYTYAKDAQRWEELPSFPGQPREEAVIFALDDRIYVGLGIELKTDTLPGELGYLNDFWCYNINNNSWDSLPVPFPGNGRKGAVAFSAAGKVYVGTGKMDDSYTGPRVQGDFYEFIPQDASWQRIESMDVTPQENALVLSSGKETYLCFGTDDKGEGKNFWRFVPETLSWEDKSACYPAGFNSSGMDTKESFTLNIDGDDYTYLYDYRDDFCLIFHYQKEQWHFLDDYNFRFLHCFTIDNQLYGVTTEADMFKYIKE